MAAVPWDSVVLSTDADLQKRQSDILTFLPEGQVNASKYHLLAKDEIGRRIQTMFNEIWAAKTARVDPRPNMLDLIDDTTLLNDKAVSLTLVYIFRDSRVTGETDDFNLVQMEIYKEAYESSSGWDYVLTFLEFDWNEDGEIDESEEAPRDINSIDRV